MKRLILTILLGLTISPAVLAAEAIDKVYISGLRDARLTSANKFVIIPRSDAAGETLEFKEYKDEVSHSLVAAGFEKSNFVDADTAVLLEYGVEPFDPKDELGFDQDPNYARSHTYLRFIKLFAFNPHTKSADTLWKANISSIGESPDLRAIFPAMLVSVQQYIGKDTQSIKTADLTHDEKLISDYTKQVAP